MKLQKMVEDIKSIKIAISKKPPTAQRSLGCHGAQESNSQNVLGAWEHQLGCPTNHEKGIESKHLAKNFIALTLPNLQLRAVRGGRIFT